MECDPCHTCDMIIRMATRDSKQASSPTKNDETKVSINVAIPAQLHRQLRIKAINEGISVTEAVTTALKEWTA